MPSAIAALAIAGLQGACDVGANPALEREGSDRVREESERDGSDPQAVTDDAGRPRSLLDAALSPDLEGRAPEAGWHDPPGTVTKAPDAGEARERDSSAAIRPSEFAVGTIRIELAAHDGRMLPVQLWYPAVEEARAEARAGHPTEDFEPPGERRDRLMDMIDAAPDTCTNRTMHAAIGARPHPLGAPFPLIVFSHHHQGVRFSLFTSLERLASLGFVVAAPDHEGDTVYDRTDDVLAGLDTLNAETLRSRAMDIGDLLDLMLDADATQVPEGLRGKIDPERVGAAGHSMGSLTTGMVGVNEERVKAAAYVAMAPSADLVESPPVQDFRVPALYLIAREDAVGAMIAALYGMELMAAEFAEQAPPAWLVEVRDTAHYSFADDCALVVDLVDGCGKGNRAADWSEYTNLDNVKAREIASRYLAAFFASQFLGQPGDRLERADPPELVSVRKHP